MLSCMTIACSFKTIFTCRSPALTTMTNTWVNLLVMTMHTITVVRRRYKYLLDPGGYVQAPRQGGKERAEVELMIVIMGKIDIVK